MKTLTNQCDDFTPENRFLFGRFLKCLTTLSGLQVYVVSNP